FVQDNRSSSSQNVLRGLHFQKTKPQGKLVTVTKGEVFDVAVDLRKDSRTFGQYESVILTEENKKIFYIPPGFAHGFCVLSNKADFLYKCTDFYDPNDEGGIIWNDSSLSIEWPVNAPILSKKDMELPTLKNIRQSLLDGF
ncbi:dTDP-4-dehydrorhamnose 3,5-epimerase, partial [Escherichia coli]|nr:dTDP-4-dehydrorhamnose 3,5-epimerase [Escherichia coli]